MRISVTDAKAQLTELVRRAEAGAAIILTAMAPVARSCKWAPRPEVPARRAQPCAIPPRQRRRRARARHGRMDFLYGANGLPE